MTFLFHRVEPGNHSLREARSLRIQRIVPKQESFFVNLAFPFHFFVAYDEGDVVSKLDLTCNMLISMTLKIVYMADVWHADLNQVRD